MTAQAHMFQPTPYLSYTYAYPHKTAYRVFDPPVALGEVWAGERRDRLFLYVHVPFCEMRCGFCNLFTTIHTKGGIEAAYLDALERQARRVNLALGPASFARMAIGGGTPTYLDCDGLARLFDIATRLFQVDLDRTPISVETSPATAEPARLQLLRSYRVDRISIGVQSFVEAEVAAVGRSQRTGTVETALEAIHTTGFPTLNIDLIYGLPGQTVASWLHSLERALYYRPEELYLYPLYVRPLTGLGRTGKNWDDIRRACYRAARERLLDAGYTQISMRMFRAAHAPDQDGPVYCCQEDGMVGLGCGARSYTRTRHYSSEYAVGASGVRAILADYIARPDKDFDIATYGFVLNPDEQRRRYLLQSLLQCDGLSLAAYARRFGSAPFHDLPSLNELIEQGLAVCSGGVLQLTAEGLEYSDAIGPWLYSPEVCRLMAEYELR